MCPSVSPPAGLAGPPEALAAAYVRSGASAREIMRPYCAAEFPSQRELPCLAGTHKSDRLSPQELCWLSSAAKFPMTAEFPVGGLTQYGKRHDLHQTAGDSVRHVRLCCTWSCCFSRPPWPDFDFGRAIFLLSFTLFLSGVLMRRGLAALLKKYLAPFECALGPVA